MSEQPIAYEEVPGSRTTQDTVVQPQRERIAYEDLQPGDIIQEGDEWQNECGRWRQFLVLDGSRVQVRQSQRVRRPHSITMMLREFASQAEVLAEVRVDEKRLFDDLELLRSEYVKLQHERDELRAEMDTVKGDRMNLREALTAEQRAHTVTMASGLEACKERDEARTERDRLQEVVGNLYNEPTARQVQDMLRTWATELDWSAGCFDSVAREQIDSIQRTLIAVIERIEGLVSPEGGSDDN